MLMSNNSKKRIEEFAASVKNEAKWNSIRWDAHLDLLDWPLSESLHNQFCEEDKSLLLKLAESGKVPPLGRKFGVRLLAHIRDPEVKQLFWRKWDEAINNQDPNHLLTEFLCWRLTDYAELTEDEHWRIFDAVRNDFNHFKNKFIGWIGNDLERVLTAVRQRLEDNRYPSSKDWLYLCGACAAPSDRQRELKDLLAEHKERQDFTGRVAGVLLLGKLENTDGMA